MASAPKIIARSSSKPRQGVNTGGANDVFVLNKMGSTFTDAQGRTVAVEQELLFPLMQKAMFSGDCARIEDALKWIIIPHDRKSGHPISW